ncbi:MAG TPA: ATP-binding cassette domain-containing protein [Solirubrobacteraceae bacterium]|nr:ATP-binding cassette domain-containing protein [Solirubrobacteraceae bacterium]
MGAASDERGATRVLSGSRPAGVVDRGPSGVFSGIHEAIGQRVRIGRDSDNDVVVPDLLVSRFHAELRARSDGRRELLDLNSRNGTFVNGRAVDRAIVEELDIVTVGHHTFRLVGLGLEEFVDTGLLSFQAEALEVRTADERSLLSNVTFSLDERSFLAIVGPSGAGKSTLLNALTGFRPATGGQVLYGGRDLYKDYDELRLRIGYVPQEDVLHRGLTVNHTLDYGAQLRFPRDVGAAERFLRIEQVLGQLGIDSKRDVRVGDLSGGQRRRVAVALELITKPSLLFLDEPTSGLDPGHEHGVMTLLRALADEGRTVIAITHNMQSIRLCDQLLVLAPGGRLAYFGRPQLAPAFFECEDLQGVFQLLNSEPDRDWGGLGSPAVRARLVQLQTRIRALERRIDELGSENGRVAVSLGPDGTAQRQTSGHDYPDRVGGVALEQAGAAAPRLAPEPGVGRKPSPAATSGADVPRGGLPPAGADDRLRARAVGGRALLRGAQRGSSQFGVLVRRYVRVSVADRRNASLLVLQPLILGALMLAALPAHELAAPPAGAVRAVSRAGLVLLVVLLGATWIGASNAAREIVRELPNFQRERAAGVGVVPYLASKVVVLGALTSAQCTVMALLALARQGSHDQGSLLQSPLPEVVLAAILAGVCGMALGLLISALVSTADQAMTVLPVVLLLELLLAMGGLFPDVIDKPVLKQLSYAASTQWAFAASASSVDLGRMQALDTIERGAPTIRLEDPIAKFQPLASSLQVRSSWKHEPDAWLEDVGFLVLIASVSIAGAGLSLRNRHPQA